MITNLNDVYRDKILNKQIDSLTNNEVRYALDIMLSDLYKMSLYEFTKGNNDYKYIEKNFKYLKKILINDKSLLVCAVKALKDFRNMSLINKSILMENISILNKNEILTCINKFHFLDTMVYSFRYDLDYFVLLYKDYVDKCGILNAEIAINFVCDYINKLKVINYDKYKNFILELVKCYYKASLYEKNNNLEFNNLFRYSDKIEKNSLKDIYVELDKNASFLFDVMSNYLIYNLCEKKVREEIDNCFIKNATIDIQKKLKFDI